MIKKIKSLILIVFVCIPFVANSQDYYYKDYKPFNKSIPSPEEFLGYPIGDYHTRHDLVVSYLEKLAELSENATFSIYGKTYENRKLILLTISSNQNHKNLEKIKTKHLQVVNGNTDITDFSDLPIIISLGYGVHGNEASSTEAALLTAYILVASENEKVQRFRDESVIFLDPTINPDGRDRHTNWVNNFRGEPLIADKYDIEHNESWPGGRTNHYWFDLNRDLLLGVHDESNARLKWYHDWYPNVVTDFHEMGTNSTYFFEPKNKSASLNPITPSENRSVLNKVFAEQFSEDLDKIGSLYFTDEVYDSTYPGYGSTYMDLQGSLALLFEQASSRGHLQENSTGEISFSFAIKNQFVSSIATIKASIKNKQLLYEYQNMFFVDAKNKAAKSKVKGYVFGDDYDANRNKAFIDLLLKHHINVYPLEDDLEINNKKFSSSNSYVVPTEQKQYYMVQSIFETYNQYRDSVYYDTSSWSLVNFYNMKYHEISKIPKISSIVSHESNKIKIEPVSISKYAYIIPYDDYYAPAFMYQLLKNKVIVKTSTKPFSILSGGKEVQFNRGSFMVSVRDQVVSKDSLFSLMIATSKKYDIQVYHANSGFTIRGNGLGSRSFQTVKKPKVMMIVEGEVSSYEAGEVWHLFEKRMDMPITKIPERNFLKVDLNRYNVIIMVSGNYKLLDEKSRGKLKEWVSNGHTLITSAKASTWVVKNKIVNESLIEKSKDSLIQATRMNYGDSRGSLGKQNIGGAIFEVDLDITHPIGFGYQRRSLPVYKNNKVFLKASSDKFSTVASYTKEPHIDGYISDENLDFLQKSASIIVSKIGKGRVVLFADNPNFRGAWYGTNKLFMNAVLFGSLINIPK